MPAAEARIPTDRAERYLEQLCSHLGAMAHMRHMPAGGHGGAAVPRVEHIERTETHAVIGFAEGSWNLQASPDALTLRVEAEDAAALEKLKTAIAARIAKIGRRDGLQVDWHDIQDPQTHDGSGQPGSGHVGAGATPGRRRWWRRARWFAVIALAVALHLGLIGSLLGSGRWKDVAADVLIALLVLKLVLIALHARFGRRTAGHG